jgi:hypothetical protein
MSHTVNPALPHPDQDTDDVKPMPLADAIGWAVKALYDDKADKWTRRKAADELLYAFECMGDHE